MAAEPIEEDDSFNDPLPRAIKTVPRPVASKPPPHQPLKKPDSDPESEDSFDTFLPTQTTGGGSIKSSAGSTQSNEHKPPAPTIPPPFRLQPPPTAKPPFSLSTQASGGFAQHQNSYKPTNAPFIHTQTNRTPRKGPPPSFHPLCAVPPQQSQVHILRKPETSATGKEAISQHSEIINAINREMSQQSTSSDPFSASPNSLSRHRSVNSCLRNNPLNTSSVRTGNILNPRTTPLYDSGRPGALRGDVIMLRDQLENEKRKVLRLQADFQKDFLKKEEEHHRLLAKRDEIIEKHRKEIEVLKSTIACKTPESPATFAPRLSIAPCIPAQMAPSPPSTSITRLATASSSADVKKRYPKIPADQRLRTPQRNATVSVSVSHQVSVFRHSLKELEDDTFQIDASFEPSATSTPKFSGNKRIGLRRPLSHAEDGLDENSCGAPAAKRKPFFMEERRRRTREELNEKIKEIWNNIDRDSANTLPHISTSTKGKSEKMDTQDNYDGEWMDRHLSRRMKHLMVRKSESKKKRKREKMTNRARQKLLRQAESKPAPPKCAVCLLDPILSRDFLKSSERNPPQPVQKEWEAQENQKVELLKKRAEEKRLQYYSMLVSSICQNGIYEVEGITKRKEQAEREHRQRIAEFKPRGLEELREEKRDQWRTDIMSELSEKGEMYAGMELNDVGRKEDYIWTEDEDDEDWMFPIPYNHPRSALCAGCARLQKRQRRIVKREREKLKIRSDCLQEYAEEQREQLRNTSILTKSRIERARICLYRENDISTDSFDELVMPDEGEDENSF